MLIAAGCASPEKGHPKQEPNSGAVKRRTVPINQPAGGGPRSFLQEYIFQYHRGMVWLFV